MKQTQVQSFDHTAVLYEETSSLKKRKEYGQFFTPYDIAKFMVELLFKENDTFPESEMILDPASGLSIFGHAIRQSYGKFDFTAYEIDPEVASIGECPYTNIYIEDYLFANSHIGQYSKIIANPPYLKHINIPNKEFLNFCFSKKINKKIPITSNYYCYFLIKIIEELAPGGKAVIILPNEIFSSNYGVFFKKIFLKRKIVQEIFFFENNTNIFRDAITTPVILVLKNQINDRIKIHKIDKIIHGKVLCNKSDSVFYENLEPGENWVNYLNHPDLTKYALTEVVKIVNFNEYAIVRRGIATGANNFFILSEDERVKKNIDKKYFLPCIASANALKNIILTSEYINNHSSDKKSLLLNLSNYDGGDPFVEQYIQEGENNHFDKKYLTSHRSPWYSMESIDFIGDIFISTFSRSFFKVTINDARMCNLTCVHAIIFKDVYKKFIPFFYAYYQSSFAQRLLLEKSRMIGNGLKKIEPNDVAKIPLPNVNVLPQEILKNIENLTLQYFKTRSSKLLVEIDILFSGLLSI